MAEFGHPGPMRDRLIAAIQFGAKTTTTSLLADYQACGEPLPSPGSRWRLVDSAGRGVGIVETADVRITRLADVDLAHVIAEGENFTDIVSWRTAHEQFWNSAQSQSEHGQIDINDDTVVVLERFGFVQQ